MSNVKHDNVFFEILQEEKTIINFFDAIFGFLSRRTDFYYVSKSPKEPVGVPEGWAEKIIYDAFKKYKSDSDKPQDFPTAVENDIEVETSVSENQYTEHNTEEKIDQTSVREDKDSIKFESAEKSDCYNGAVYDNYSWSQNITDVDIQVKIPDELTAKQLRVNIQPDSLDVNLIKSDTPILEGMLPHKIKPGECLWSINNKILQIHLEKTKDVWWDCLFTHEPKLNLQEMDCSIPFHDLPDDAQAKIEELQWNQERKRLGLPTSHQLKNEDMLRRAWNAKGSPFQGTPFDPSTVQFINN